MRQTFSEYWSETKRADVASLGRRLVAYLIDHFLVVLALVLAIGPLGAVLRGVPTNDELEIGMVLLTIWICAVVTLYLFCKDGWNGRGVGKRLMGLRVIYLENHQPIRARTSALRYLMLRLLQIIEIIFICVHPNHRGIGDWLGRSVVIKKP